MNRLLKSVSVFATILSMALAMPVSGDNAPPTGPAKPMVLRTVMEKLGRDMQAVAGAISKEDWARVAALSPEIASHEQPPAAEKMRILAWLGAEAGRFRGFDGQVHEAATAMSEAAMRGDGRAVIAAFARVQQGCLECHQGFRKSFVEHFHGTRN